MVLRLDIDTAEYDRMRHSVVFAANRAQVIVSLEALESFFSRSLDAEEAVEGAMEAGNIIRLAANATPADDGMINITSKILNGRQWELGERDEAEGDNAD